MRLTLTNKGKKTMPKSFTKKAKITGISYFKAVVSSYFSSGCYNLHDITGEHLEYLTACFIEDMDKDDQQEYLTEAIASTHGLTNDLIWGDSKNLSKALVKYSEKCLEAAFDEEIVRLKLLRRVKN